ncbi:MAG: aldo/keto reductase [Alphaproteobacteria bacterium]
MAETQYKEAGRPFRAGLSSLVLGTAQLGLAYGPKAETGVMTPVCAENILSAAAACGITCLDTARAYGVAEARIGAWCRAQDLWPQVVTKLPALTDGDDVARTINDSLTQSLAALGRTQIDGYLVHRARDLMRPGVADCLRREIDGSRIGAFGVSVYTPEEAAQALRVPGLGLLQVPVSLVNQEMIESGVLAQAANTGCVVFARSVLVQGLMLCPVDGLPKHWLGAKQVLVNLHGLAAEAGFSLVEIALAAVSSCDEVQSLVVGCDDGVQVKEIATAMAANVPRDVIGQALVLAHGLPEDVVDPRLWKV